MTNHSGKQLSSSSEREREVKVKVSVPPPPESEVVGEVEKESHYVAPPPYKPIVPFP